MGLCVATTMGLGVGVSAQAGSTPKDQMAPMTVSGCVMAGKQANEYMLGNAMMMGAGHEKGQPAAAGASPMMSYELVGGRDMKARMGHKVEVMGTMSKTDTDRMMMMDKMDKMAKDKMMADKSMAAMKLNITSVKMVSATCS